MKESQPFEIWSLFNEIQNLTSKQFLLYSSSEFSLGLTMWAPHCHGLEQVRNRNEKHMVWMSKCHWGDCSWFLLAVYGSIYVYGTLKKKSQIIPCQLSGKWSYEDHACVCKDLKRGKLWWKSCVSLNLSSYTADRPQQPMGRDIRVTLSRMVLSPASTPQAGPWQGKSSYAYLNNACTVYCSNYN